MKGLPGKFLIVDIWINVHLSGVDLHNSCSGFFCRSGELDFSVQSSRSEQGGIKNVNSVCCSNNLETNVLVL